MCAMARGFPETARQFEGAPPLRADIPLVVLTASSARETMPPALLRLVDAESIRAELETTHRAFAQRSSRGTWRKVPDSTHLIAGSQPDAVADAVFDILDQLK
jgi:hypothetical protein